MAPGNGTLNQVVGLIILEGGFQGLLRAITVVQLWIPADWLATVTECCVHAHVYMCARVCW